MPRKMKSKTTRKDDWFKKIKSWFDEAYHGKPLKVPLKGLFLDGRGELHVKQVHHLDSLSMRKVIQSYSERCCLCIRS